MKYITKQRQKNNIRDSNLALLEPSALLRGPPRLLQVGDPQLRVGARLVRLRRHRHLSVRGHHALHSGILCGLFKVTNEELNGGPTGFYTEN